MGRLRELVAGIGRRTVVAVYLNPVMRRLITGQFHRLFYYAAHRDQTWKDTRWLGIPTLKCVFDLWVYQEIIHELRPELIIECGSGYGGSTLFFASICDLIDHGRVVSIDDRDDLPRPDHRRIRYLQGSSGRYAPYFLSQDTFWCVSTQIMRWRMS